MAVPAIVRTVDPARTATAIGVTVYVLIGGLGLWAGSWLWSDLVPDQVLVASVLGGPTAAIGAVSALGALVGVGAAAALVDRWVARSGEATRARMMRGAVIGTTAAAGPSILIVIACEHPLAGIVVTVVALILPSALTGVLGVLLMRRVAPSGSLTRLFLVLKWVAVLAVGLWAAVSFAPWERWLPLLRTA